MSGTRISTISLLVLTLAFAAFAGADPDYFPLQVGNTWVYRTNGVAQSIETLEVVRWDWFNNQVYYLRRGGRRTLGTYGRQRNLMGVGRERQGRESAGSL